MWHATRENRRRPTVASVRKCDFPGFPEKMEIVRGLLCTARDALPTAVLHTDRGELKKHAKLLNSHVHLDITVHD